MNKYVRIFQKNILKIILIVLSLATIFLGLNIVRLQRQLDNKRRELNSQNEKLNLCFSDRAQIKQESKKTYSPQEFKISSPLFEGEEMTVKTLSYKGVDIKEMSIDLPQGDNIAHPINIKVYDYVNVPYQKVARFDDFYNALPVQTDTSVAGEPAYYKYVTSKGFNMNRSCGELTIWRNITSIHSIYVVISGYQCTGIFPGQEEQTIKESTRSLEIVADTISF